MDTSTDAMDYRPYLYPFEEGKGLSFDHNYRLCHLPLANASHPMVINHQPGKLYQEGYYALAKTSLVLMVHLEELISSKGFVEFEKAVKQAPFAHKVNWALYTRRKPLLHVTLCGGLEGNSIATLRLKTKDWLSQRKSPDKLIIRGAFVGQMNTGRIYLKAYTLKGEGNNEHENPWLIGLQNHFEAKQSPIILLGLYNLTESLNPDEAKALNELLLAYWAVQFLEKEVSLSNLRLVTTNNDLILDATLDEING